MKNKRKIKGLKPHHLNGQLILHTGQKDGVIFQELHSKENNKIERIIQWLFDTRDMKIKETLAEMGWTSPAAWVNLKEFQEKADKGPCWIAYKGCVVHAYYDDIGVFRFHKHSPNAYLRECITAIQAIRIPQMPDNKRATNEI